MREKTKIGISACLLGERVRYDGGHKLDLFLRDALGRFVEYVPVCPEAEAGFGVPREAMQLEGAPDAPRLITIYTRRDMTEAMADWTGKRLDELANEGLQGFILKSRSPSCGVGTAPLFGEAGEAAQTTSGIFAGMLMRRFPLLPVADEAGLSVPEVRDEFFGRVFTPEGWVAIKKVIGKDNTP